MPRHETIMSIFVASHSDILDERKPLESIVHELNKIWSRMLHLRIEEIKYVRL